MLPADRLSSQRAVAAATRVRDRLARLDLDDSLLPVLVVEQRSRGSCTRASARARRPVSTAIESAPSTHDRAPRSGGRMAASSPLLMSAWTTTSGSRRRSAISSALLDVPARPARVAARRRGSRPSWPPTGRDALIALASGVRLERALEQRDASSIPFVDQSSSPSRAARRCGPASPARRGCRSLPRGAGRPRRPAAHEAQPARRARASDRARSRSLARSAACSNARCASRDAASDAARSAARVNQRRGLVTDLVPVRASGAASCARGSGRRSPRRSRRGRCPPREELRGGEVPPCAAPDGRSSRT